VLVVGASGTGKELAARAVHDLSRRKDGPFVSENCAAIPRDLIEAELFGHRKGAFTGADRDRVGLFERAAGGTLFLDEIGELPLDLQAKLLRVLETREVTPVGGNEVWRVDVRLIAATNQDLHAMVKAGTFREDLLFRLQVVVLELPRLADRAGDVPLLLDHFIGELAAHHGREVRGITPEARALLVRYDWPGNVRELRNAVENMVLLARGDVLTVDDVPESIKGGGKSGGTLAGGFDLAGRSLEEMERALIAENLKLMDGNRQKAAKVLGIGERTLYRKLKEYGL
jgi:two-component system response regulator HydG